MKKTLVFIVAIAVFVLLYFLPGKQERMVEQQAGTLISDSEKTTRKVSQKNNLTESVSDLKKQIRMPKS